MVIGAGYPSNEMSDFSRLCRQSKRGGESFNCVGEKESVKNKTKESPFTVHADRLDRSCPCFPFSQLVLDLFKYYNYRQNVSTFKVNTVNN